MEGSYSCRFPLYRAKRVARNEMESGYTERKPVKFETHLTEPQGKLKI